MKRRGFTLLEIMVAAVLLAAAATISVEIVLLSATAQRAAARQHMAAREAANVMERLMAMPYDELTPEAARRAKLAKPAADALPEAKLDVAVEEGRDAGVPSKRVKITLSWSTTSATPLASVRLAAWRFDAREAKP
jgi:prepilin-type N-terminal cleavage/methylation domain-containing protein